MNRSNPPRAPFSIVGRLRRRLQKLEGVRDRLADPLWGTLDYFLDIVVPGLARYAAEGMGLAIAAVCATVFASNTMVTAAIIFMLTHRGPSRIFFHADGHIFVTPIDMRNLIASLMFTFSWGMFTLLGIKIFRYGRRLKS